ncbi:MAG: 30S ribosomal protein S4 [bacterium]|jgi:small subunit ribosomal protein S4
MSVVWEAKCRLCRRAQQKLFLKGDRCVTRKCAIERETRQKPPGQHGEEKLNKKITQYGEQLREKQKLKRAYLLRETQFATYMVHAQRRRGVTGENLIQLLEMRLDNTVYRLGWAPSRGAARQMVSHGFITVNGKRVDIASCQTRQGDVIGIYSTKKETTLVVEALKRLAVAPRVEWLSMNLDTLEGTVLAMPKREQIVNDIMESLIVEFYTR